MCIRDRVAGIHPRVEEILEDRHLLPDPQVLEVGRGLDVAAPRGEEVRFVEAQRVTDKDDPAGRSLRNRLCRPPQFQGLERQRQGCPELQEFSSAVPAHSFASLSEYCITSATSVFKRLFPGARPRNSHRCRRWGEGWFMAIGIFEILPRKIIGNFPFVREKVLLQSKDVPEFVPSDFA